MGFLKHTIFHGLPVSVSDAVKSAILSYLCPEIPFGNILETSVGDSDRKVSPF